MTERRKLGDLLMEAGLIDEFRLNQALADQRQWGRPLGVTLVNLGLVDEVVLTRVLSEQLSLPVIDLENKVAPPELVELVPYELANKHRCLPLVLEGEGAAGKLHLGMFDPTDLEAIDNIRFRTGHRIQPVLVGDQQLSEAIRYSYQPGDVLGRFTQITAEDIRPHTAGSPAREPREGPRPEASRPAPEASRPEVPPAPGDEPEILLSTPARKRELEFILPDAEREPFDRSGTHALLESIAAQSLETRGDILQALVQLMISKGMLDPSELLAAIESIAAARK